MFTALDLVSVVGLLDTVLYGAVDVSVVLLVVDVIVLVLGATIFVDVGLLASVVVFTL